MSDECLPLCDLHPEQWRDRANCRDVDPDVFFPKRGESTTPALKVCAGCTVRDECLNYALTMNLKWGVWGGRSERARRTLRRQRRQDTYTATCPGCGEVVLAIYGFRIPFCERCYKRRGVEAARRHKEAS